jgi:AsmA protein
MRWIVRILGVVVLIAVIAVSSLFVIPTDRIVTAAYERFEQTTGRSLRIDGGIRPSLFPSLGVRVMDVEIGNPDWVTQGPLMRADRMHIAVSWASLFSGEVKLEGFEFAGPDLVFVRRADGIESWALDTAVAAETIVEEETTANGITFSFEQAELSNARVRFLDLSTGQDLTLEGVDARVTLPDPAGPLTLAMSAILNGTPLELEGRIESTSAFLAGGVEPLTLALSWDGGTVGLDGRAGIAPVGFDGQVNVAINDLGPVMAIAGSAAPVLPRGFGRDEIELNAQVTYASEGSIHLRQAQVTLDQNQLVADLDILPQDERMLVRGRIQGSVLDLSTLSDGGSDSAASSGWSNEAIDVSGLFGVDLDVVTIFEAVDLGAARLGATEIRSALTAGRMVLELRQIALYGGSLGGEFVVNGRGGLSVGGTLTLNNVQLSPLLSELADYDRLEGQGSAQLQFLGVGNSMDAIMRSLSGQGRLDLGGGTIQGLDLGGMLRNLDMSYQGEGTRTVYDSMTSSFTINGGVLSNDDFLLAASFGEVSGAGAVNIGAQTLDYRMIPRVLSEGGAGGFSVPILISGPWANLSFRPDLEFLARQELEAELDAVEAAARERLAVETQRLEQQVRDQLAEEAQGLLGQGTENIQENLQDQLRQEAEDQLRRLLGR